LITESDSPFWICDTDVIFYDKAEDWKFDTAIAGFRVPEFNDEFTGAITRSRLHPSLMYIRPSKFREQAKAYESAFPVTEFNPLANLVNPLCLPLNGRGYFHDTMSMAYHAIGGTPFTEQQCDSYFHMHFGTCSDVVMPRMTNGKQMAEWRQAVLDNHELGRGSWRYQMQYFSSRKPVYDGKDVVKPVSKEDSVTARQWNAEMCLNDPEAMDCCDLAYGLFHGFDDLIDTCEDGRPTMSKQQIADLFLNETLFYNCKFYNKHRELLYPILVNINRTFADSVAWENAPEPHLRAIADINRMAGNDFYAMVALIKGGIRHRDFVARRLKEKDYLLQHSPDGYPI